jgi:hypothetical protein
MSGDECPPMPADWPVSFTSDEAAEKLGCSAKSLQRAAKAGTAPIPHYVVGDRVLRWAALPIWRLLCGVEPVLGSDQQTTPSVAHLRRRSVG